LGKAGIVKLEYEKSNEAGRHYSHNGSSLAASI